MYLFCQRDKRLSSMQRMLCAMMLSSRLFLEDITCSHWVPLSYMVSNTGFRRTLRSGAHLAPLLPRFSESCCPPPNTHPATPSRFLHATWPPSLQASTFQVQHSSVPPFSSRLSNKDRLQPRFYPWRFSLWCLTLQACTLRLQTSHLMTSSIRFNH